MRILTVDPGERVGWAHATIENDVFEVTGQGVTPLKLFAVTLYDAIENYDVVAYETWRLRPKEARKFVGNDFQASQLIGMIRLLGWKHPSVKLVSLGPETKATAIRTQPDWLRERTEQSTEEHDKDALHLLWFYYWQNYVKPKLLRGGVVDGD